MILSEVMNEALANDIRNRHVLVLANLAGMLRGRSPALYAGQTGLFVRRMRLHTVYQMLKDDMEYVIRRTLACNGFPGFLR